MQHLKKYFLLLFCAFSLLATAQNNVIDEVIWIVGDEAILKSEVEEQRIRMQYEGMRSDGDPYCSIPEELAIQKLLLHQAEVDSIVESPNMVASQVESRLNHFINQIGSKEKMEEYFGKTTSVLREELMEIIGNQMRAQSVQQSITGDIKLTPSEVRNYYTSLPQDEIPMMPAKVEVQIITIEPKISVQEIEEIKAKLRGYKERAESGEIEFSTLAVLYSEDTESARRGGEMGFAGRGAYVPEFSAAAFNLSEPGKISQVVETEYGFHIIQLVEKRGDRASFRHILLKPRVSLQEKTDAMQKLDSIADNIRNNKRTFEEAVVLYSTDKNTKMNAGLMPNTETGDSKFQLQELPPEVAKVVDKMNVGEISAPFIMRNSSGKEVCAIVKVKSKIKTHMANMNDDYQEIKNALLTKKGMEAFDKWIVQKQKETYIWIKDSWQGCEFKYPGWIKTY